MIVTTEKENERLKLILEGDMTTLAAADFEKAYETGKDGASEILLDFEKLTYITSAGLRVILFIQQEMEDIGGSLSVCGVNNDIMDVFIFSGFVQFLNIQQKTNEQGG